ncbi:MAG: hypothetical protein CMF77_04800 [Candidatus Marinimicrobia bacterium]|mgnify:CR=1 FL=1|nr:hypothetical protein [Candidatus Neomarinimicrobiota bacterium]
MIFQHSKSLLFLGLSLYISLAQTQTTYKTVADLEEEWKKYTSFQKVELLNFCDYLFAEGHYERSVLACFRFLFLHPEDELIPVVYYRVARSYELSGNFKLAIEYYQKVQAEVQPNASEYIAADHRLTALYLFQGDYEFVHNMAEGSEDPYQIVFDAYAAFSELKWDEAKAGFGKVRKQFKGKEKRKVLAAMMRACDSVVKLPQRNPLYAGLFGIFPGGGRIYLQDYVPATGTFVATTGLIIQVAVGGATFFSSWVPGTALVLLYGSSIWGSMRDIDFSNRQRAIRYTQRVREKYGAQHFLDFPEPRNLGAN